MTLHNDMCTALIFMLVLPFVCVLPVVAASHLLFLHPLAVLCAAMACILTGAHLINILRTTRPAGLWAAMIMLMVPIYAVLCWMTMLLQDFADWFEIFKSLYESFVLLCFLMLLSAKGQPDEEKAPSALGQFWSVLQYVILNMAMALVHFTVPSLSALVNLLLCIASFVSCSFALAAVVALHHKHKASSPSDAYKFWCIKGVVSMMFSQHLLLTSGLPFIASKEGLTPLAMERIIICFEMFLLSVAHLWAYPKTDFDNAVDLEECSEEPSAITHGRNSRMNYSTATPARRQASIVVQHHMDGVYGIVFLCVFSGLVVAMYCEVLKVSQAEKVAANQEKQCHWYYWLRYLDRCNPEYYRMEEWLKQSAQITHSIRICLMSFFVVLFGFSGAYIFQKSGLVKLQPKAAAQALWVAERALFAFLALASIPMAGVAAKAMLVQK